MKNIILLLYLTFTSLSSSKIIAQTYSTGFDNATEQSGWNQYRVGANDPYYEWEYTTSDALSSPNCLLHNYPVGGSEVTDDWFVSPVFDFSEGGTIDSVWASIFWVWITHDGRYCSSLCYQWICRS